MICFFFLSKFNEEKNGFDRHSLLYHTVTPLAHFGSSSQDWSLTASLLWEWNLGPNIVGITHCTFWLRAAECKIGSCRTPAVPWWTSWTALSRVIRFYRIPKWSGFTQSHGMTLDNIATSTANKLTLCWLLCLKIEFKFHLLSKRIFIALALRHTFQVPFPCNSWFIGIWKTGNHPLMALCAAIPRHLVAHAPAGRARPRGPDGSTGHELIRWDHGACAEVGQGTDGTLQWWRGACTVS